MSANHPKKLTHNRDGKEDGTFAGNLSDESKDEEQSPNRDYSLSLPMPNRIESIDNEPRMVEMVAANPYRIYASVAEAVTNEPINLEPPPGTVGKGSNRISREVATTQRGQILAGPKTTGEDNPVTQSSGEVPVYDRKRGRKEESTIRYTAPTRKNKGRKYLL